MEHYFDDDDVDFYKPYNERDHLREEQKRWRMIKQEKAHRRLVDAVESLSAEESTLLQKIENCTLDGLKKICFESFMMVSGSKVELIDRVFKLVKHGGPNRTCVKCGKRSQEFKHRPDGTPTSVIECRHYGSTKVKCGCKVEINSAISNIVRQKIQALAIAKPKPCPKPARAVAVAAAPAAAPAAAVAAPGPWVTFEWVQCDHCEKWRKLHDVIDTDELPDRWFCFMNNDPEHNNCKAEEEQTAEEEEEEDMMSINVNVQANTPQKLAGKRRVNRVESSDDAEWVDEREQKNKKNKNNKARASRDPFDVDFVCANEAKY